MFFLIIIIHQALKRTPLHFTFWVFSRSWLGRFHWQPSSPVVRRCCVWWHSAMWWEEEQHVDVETLTLSEGICECLRHPLLSWTKSVCAPDWLVSGNCCCCLHIIIFGVYKPCSKFVICYIIFYFNLVSPPPPPVAGDSQCHAGVP